MPAFVICGPTAVGKGTVIDELLVRQPDIWLSTSVTTRQPRPNEIPDKDYYFVSDQRFDELIEHGEMLEWAIVHGQHRYGTPRQPVEQALQSGHIVLLEVDLDGARQIRQTLPQARHIFLAPPSFADLQKRLDRRGTEDEGEQQRRLRTARVELAAQDEFDHIVVNDDVGRATDELLSLIHQVG